jgi:predicted site-specific integrase-resolvase
LPRGGAAGFHDPRKLDDLVMIIAHFLGQVYGVQGHESKKMVSIVKGMMERDDVKE